MGPCAFKAVLKIGLLFNSDRLFEQIDRILILPQVYREGTRSNPGRMKLGLNPNRLDETLESVTMIDVRVLGEHVAQSAKEIVSFRQVWLKFYALCASGERPEGIVLADANVCQPRIRFAELRVEPSGAFQVVGGARNISRIGS